MEYELNDQDRADIVKNFIKKYSTLFVLALIAVALAFGAYNIIQKHEATANQNASIAYSALLTSMQNGATTATISAESQNIIKNNRGTVYASLAKLNLAGIAVQQNRLADAASILKETLAQNSHNSLTPIISLRLARVYLANNNPKMAISILKKPPAGFVGTYALLTGEGNLQEGNLVLARKNFSTAINASKNDPIVTQMAMERLNSLGASS
ncbi:MAG: tetratricopeptide repeat protein [Gammaproteobacteria bacterium]|nr:tetratricopeptide repeat protein [Gammaproteobacteria bacterium]